MKIDIKRIRTYILLYSTIFLVLIFPKMLSADTFSTTSNYTSTNRVTWDTSRFNKKTVMVTNDGQYSATVRVRAKVMEDGEYITLNEDTVDGTSDTTIYLDRYYSEVLIDCKDGDGSTDVIIDYNHGGLY